MTKESLNRRKFLGVGILAATATAGVALGVHAESPPTLTPRRHLPIIMPYKGIPFSSDTKIEVYLNNKPFYPLYYGTKSDLLTIATGFSFGSGAFVDFPSYVYGPYEFLAFRFRRDSGIRYGVISGNITHEQTYSTQLTIPVDESLPDGFFGGSLALYYAGAPGYRGLIVQNLNGVPNIEFTDDGARLVAWGTQPGDGIFKRLAGGKPDLISLIGPSDPIALLYRAHKVRTINLAASSKFKSWAA